jgi:hypothetical protein
LKITIQGIIPSGSVAAFWVRSTSTVSLEQICNTGMAKEEFRDFHSNRKLCVDSKWVKLDRL